MRGSMSLMSLWMLNDTLQNFLTKHDHHLGVPHQPQLVRAFDVYTFVIP